MSEAWHMPRWAALKGKSKGAVEAVDMFESYETRKTFSSLEKTYRKPGKT